MAYMASDPLNLSDAEFDLVMTEIDRGLRAESQQIFGRELSGLMEYTRRFEISLGYDSPTAVRIFDWFDRMYGDRLKGNMNMGFSVVLILGDIYRLWCFQFFGEHAFVASPSLIGGSAVATGSDGRDIDVVNLFEKHIEGLTPELAQRLSETDCTAILMAYSRMWDAYLLLHDAEGAVYVTEIKDDFRASAVSFRQACMTLPGGN